jgi:hypothetical protein
VILPKQAAPWYQFVGSGGVDLSSYTEKSISFRYTGSGKNLALDGAFQVDDVQIFRKIGLLDIKIYAIYVACNFIYLQLYKLN